MIDPGAPSQPAIHVQDAAIFGHLAKQVSFACAHGTTNRIVFPGRGLMPDGVLRDLVIAIHGVATGCRCAEALHQPIHVA